MRRFDEVLNDVGAHLVARRAGEPVAAYRDVPLRLREDGVLDDAQADTRRRVIGFRHVVVHEYLEADRAILHDVLRTRLGDLRDLMRALLRARRVVLTRARRALPHAARGRRGSMLPPGGPTMIDRRPLVAVALAAVLALAACSGAPTPPAPTSASGTVAPTPAVVLGVGLYVADADYFGGGGAVAPTGFVEAVPGLHFGTLGPVEDGAFTLPIPDGADLPASTLVPAEAFLLNLLSVPDCDVVASDPTARVSAHSFEGVPVPGAYVVTFEDGARQGLIADAAIDTSLPFGEAFAGRSIVTWLYADKAVDLTLEGAGCTGGSFDYAVDLELRAGWNQVAWEFDDAATAATLRLDATEELVLTVPTFM